jgi:hypothetical protein
METDVNATLDAAVEGQTAAATINPAGQEPNPPLDQEMIRALKAHILSLTGLGSGPASTSAPVAATTVNKAKPKPKPSSPITITDSPAHRDRRILTHTKLVVNDGQRMERPVEQRLQQDKGTLILADAALEALAAGDASGSAEALRTLIRRLRRASTALSRAGPGTNNGNGSFEAAYDLWREDRDRFDKEDFDPDAMDKTAIEAAVNKYRRGQGDSGMKGRTSGVGGRGYERAYERSQDRR